MFQPKAEKASGRAMCRWCGQTIEAGLPVIYLHIGSYKSKGYEWRILLESWDMNWEGLMAAVGSIGVNTLGLLAQDTRMED